MVSNQDLTVKCPIIWLGYMYRGGNRYVLFRLLLLLVSRYLTQSLIVVVVDSLLPTVVFYGF